MIANRMQLVCVKVFQFPTYKSHTYMLLGSRYLSSQNVKNQVLYFNLLNHRHWSSGPFPTRECHHLISGPLIAKLAEQFQPNCLAS